MSHRLIQKILRGFGIEIALHTHVYIVYQHICTTPCTAQRWHEGVYNAMLSRAVLIAVPRNTTYVVF